MILISVVGSVLAYLDLQAWLVVVVAWNSSCISWVEFRDHARKTARYTHVALGLRNLMTWWNNLTLVERASVDNIQKPSARFSSFFVSSPKCGNPGLH